MEGLPCNILGDEYDLTAAKIERTNMLYSLDVNGYRATQPESLLTAGTRRRLSAAAYSIRGYVS